MTLHAAPITFDFDEGIDRKTLRRLRDRFRQVNQARWQRARSALTHRQQAVLELLPLIFHLNHPALPGYLDHDCPFGLAHYEPTPDELGAAQRLARSFALRGGGKRKPDIEALFLMGSPGTLGHSVASDLDVWLCHREDVSEADVRRLERKAASVSEWAASLGLELHTFVFSAADWRAGRQRAEVNGENCGSAQHYLLLDEFYRTGIYLGGCYPLWWLIPVEDEACYQARVRQLVDCRFIRGDEYIDFGPVPEVPLEEFLGAGVWQLYKGIDSPWKSLLKLLLIECYARDRGHGPLSLAFKAAVYGGETNPDRLDPYVLLYERLEQWLVADDALERLELVRRSLYFKAGLPLSRAEATVDGWRGQLLQQLVQSWGWNETTVRMLDNRQQWRAADVLTMRRTIVGELTHSYRLLSRLARTHAVKAAISQDDMSLLGRKLFAAFQRKAGKVELINPNLAPSLAEENLAFYHQSEQTGASSQGWLLYRDLENPSDAFWQPVIRRSSNLTEMLVWCHCNGLLTRATRLNVRSGVSVLTIGELKELIESLNTCLPVPIEPAGRQALQAAARPLRTLIFVNVAIDPQAHLTERGLHKLSARHDSLGFSGGRENLVHGIDQITLNSWHEVSLYHYAAGDTLIQCLKNYLAAVCEAPATLPQLSVHCHSAGHGGAIARRVQELFTDVQGIFFAGGAGPHPLRYVIEMDRRYFVLQFSGNQPGFIGLESRSALIEFLRKPQQGYAPVLFDRYAMLDDPGLRAVCHASQPDNVQIFYQVTGERAKLWVVDELGSVSFWQQNFTSRRHLLEPLLRFFDNLIERRQLRYASGLAGGDGQRLCYELVVRDGQWRAERRPVASEDLPMGGLEVQAIGVQEGDSFLRFDIFCADQEFSVLEYGDQLIPAVAHYIRSLRRSGEQYPVYLTDVHLPHGIEPQGYQQDIQTTQYLYYRRELEQALNNAVAAGSS